MARTDSVLPNGTSLSLTLDRYQEIMRFPLAAFNGIHKDSDSNCYDCNAVWKQRDRDAMAMAILQAEEMREKELGYHLAPKYISKERHAYKHPVTLDRRHLTKVGQLTTTLIQAGIGLVLRTNGVINDPVQFEVVTDVTISSEIVVRYPGEYIPIRPSAVTVGDGKVVISIPRCRLLDPSVDTNCTVPEYDDDDSFLSSVDVYREYVDETAGATLVWWGGATCNLTLQESTQVAFPYVVSNRLSTVRVYPGVYDAVTGVWSRAAFTQPTAPNYIEISYMSGRQQSMQTEIETARLAHTLLPHILPETVDLCEGCWKHDMQPDPSDLVTPYGMCSGAVAVWMSDSRSKVGQGGMF